jgi:type II secretion system protein N
MRLPRLPFSGKGQQNEPSERYLVGLYLGFAFLVFLIALLWTFPHETLVREGLRQATAGSPTRIDFAQLRYRPPLGYEVEDLRIVPDPGSAFELQAGQLHAQPSLLSLLVPGRRNAVDLNLAIWGGQVEARIAGDPDDFAIDAVGQNLKLDEATRGAFPPAGKIYGNGRLELAVEGTDGGRLIEGALQLAIRDLALRDLMAQGFKIPDLTFETLDLEAEADGQTLQIRKLVANGNEVSIRATGKIKLNRVWKRSTLDLRFELRIDPDAPAGLRMLPRLLPKRNDGDTFYKIRGTLGKPRLQ